MRVRRSYGLCTHRTRDCTCIYQRRQVGGSAVTNVTVKLLFNYRREDFAYYAIFRSAPETEAAVVGTGIRPKFSILLAPLTPRLVATHNGTFNLDKIAPFIRREAYRKPHVGRWHCIVLPNRSNSYLAPIAIVCVSHF